MGTDTLPRQSDPGGLHLPRAGHDFWGGPHGTQGPSQHAIGSIPVEGPTFTEEICQNPVFISQDGMNASDVRQGDLGDCWFVAAAAALTLYPGILCKVVPKDQSFQGKDYAGIFHFQFWHFGQWVDVVVDDRLPTLDGKLIFVHSAQKDEFWMPLLEKAYAKLNGSYAAIRGGFLTESFVDLTGGIVEKLNLKEAQPELFKNIRMAYKRGSLMGASIYHKTEEQAKKLQDKGLIVGHAYTITDLHKILLKDKKVKLLQVRNPWGTMDWKGPWAYDSDRWSSIDDELRKTLFEKKDDGAFWMQLEDFVDCFDILEICHFSADFAEEEFAPFRWSSSCFQGTWKKALAGRDEAGAPGEVQTNPQFLVLFLEPDNLPRKKKPPKEGRPWEPTCTLLVSLMQKGWREKNLSICYDIFQASKEYLQTKDPSQRKKLLPKLKKVGTYQAIMRDVTKRFVLPPADYLIVPGSTSSQVDEFDFTLRIFTEKKHQHLEISDEIRADEEAFQAAKPSRGPSEVFENVFQKWAGKDQQIGTEEFKKFLKQNIISMGIPSNVTFSPGVCQKIIQHFSDTGTGRLNLAEFYPFWVRFGTWKDRFLKYDQDKSGTIDVKELHRLLKSSGFHLNKDTTDALLQRYGKKIDFAQLVSLLVHLEGIFRHCKELDVDDDGMIYMAKDKWMQHVNSLIRKI